MFRIWTQKSNPDTPPQTQTHTQSCGGGGGGGGGRGGGEVVAAVAVVAAAPSSPYACACVYVCRGASESLQNISKSRLCSYLGPHEVHRHDFGCILNEIS